MSSSAKPGSGDNVYVAVNPNAKCSKSSYKSQGGHGYCNCVEDGTYICQDGSKFYDAGSPANVQHIISTQNAARSASNATPTGAVKNWAPWLLGGLLLGGGLYLVFRE